MAPLGPFEPDPRIAVAVSGGADSMALALLAAAWAPHRCIALVIDHGLRPGSNPEARLACTRLAARGIPSHLIEIHLAPGPALAERARHARYHALQTACAALGILHLLIGHHAADQAETLAIRRLSQSGPSGLAGIAALVETPTLRLLRPLLTTPPDQLRALLGAAGQPWTEDPSNHDQTALRARIRRTNPDPIDPRDAAAARAAQDHATAAILAQRATLHPELYAALTPGPIAAPALAALLRMIAGRPYPLPTAQVARVAANPSPATLGGARLIRAGQGSFVLREAAAMQAPIPAHPGAIWDSRFRLGPADLPAGATLGPLGPDAAAFRRVSPLPAAILQTLPALRCGTRLLAVPHLDHWTEDLPGLALHPSPPVPAAPPPFVGPAAMAFPE